MGNVTVELIKELRTTTGLGLSDCKKALEENDGNLDKAIEYLQKKGLSSAKKKEDRVTAQGVVFIFNDGKTATIFEMNCETDFVARNDKFQTFIREIGLAAVKSQASTTESFLQYKEGEHTIEQKISLMTGLLGEKISLRRMSRISVAEGEGAICHYIHGAIDKEGNMGKIGTLVLLKTSKVNDELMLLGKQIAMHVTATNPEVLDVKDFSAERIEALRNIFKTRCIESGKPANIIDKMLEGMMSKFYSESVCKLQNFILDDSMNIEQVLAAASNKHNTPIQLISFLRYGVGEGIETNQSSEKA